VSEPKPVRERTLRSPLRFIPYAVDVWCVLLKAKDLARGHIKKVTVLGVDYAVFRDERGEVHGIEDRCPHRGIELSLGRVEGSHIRCVYHGWRIDGSSARILGKEEEAAVEPSCLKRIVLRERYGLVWCFIGDPDRAAAHPLPEITGYGREDSVDMLIRKPIASHWSYTFDNGIDLFHFGLHAEVPFFFRILSLENFGSEKDRFTVHYRAIMPDYFGRNREGDLFIHVDGNVFRLDMGEHLRIHGVSTPVSSNGRQIEMWWFISIFAPKRPRPVLRLLRPLFKYQISRGFQQDVDVLESEQRAFDDGLRVQRETNPAVYAAHEYLINSVIEQALAMAPNLTVENVSSSSLLPQALRGEIGIIFDDGEEIAVIDPEQNQDRLLELGDLKVGRYQHLVMVRP